MVSTLYIPIENLSIDDLPLDLGGSSIDLVRWDPSPILEHSALRVFREPGRLLPTVLTPSRVGEEPRRTLDRVLTVFRLFREEEVASNRVVEVSEDGSARSDEPPHYTIWGTDRFNAPYRLTSQDRQSFREFWIRHFEIARESFPVTEFTVAHYSPYTRYTLTQYVACLEHLLAPRDGDKAHRLALLGSLLLFQPADRTALMDAYLRIRRLYDIRSGYVHGDQSVKPDLEVDTREARNLVRRAIVLLDRPGLLSDSDRRRQLLCRLGNRIAERGLMRPEETCYLDFYEGVRREAASDRTPPTRTKPPC